jgi:hypothetical protein
VPTEGGSGNRILQAFDDLSGNLLAAVRAVYGERLASLAIFGSVARRTPSPESDLDILVLADRLPDGRMARVKEFEPVEQALATLLWELEGRGVRTDLSPVFRTPAELAHGGPIFLDMVGQVIMLYDRDGVLSRYLSQLEETLRSTGARRIPYKGAWYWDLGPAQPDERKGQPTESMTLAQACVFRATKRLKILGVLLDERSYSDVVREAQELVELALKGILRQIGIDPPKQRDVGSLLLEYRERLPDSAKASADRLAAISKRLRKELELAFYGAVDFIPTMEYGREDATLAIEEAAIVVRAALEVVELPGPA